MGELETLGESSSCEAVALGRELRVLHSALGISVRRYASRCHFDPGTVSRFLNGKRVPPWGFVMGLLTEVAEHRGEPATPEAIAHLRQLHRKAITVSAATGRVQELQHLLEETDEQVREYQAREQATAELLQDRQRRLQQVRLEMRAVEAARAVDREEHETVLAEQQRAQDRLRAERDQLQRQVTRLTKELADAQRATALAEERCAQLERQLDAAEEAERREEPEDVPPHPRPSHRPGRREGPQESVQHPSPEEMAHLVRQLIKATGLRLHRLAVRTHSSAQSWSAYQRGVRPIPPDAVRELLRMLPYSTSAELMQRAHRLLEALETAQPAASPTAPREPDSSARSEQASQKGSKLEPRASDVGQPSGQERPRPTPRSSTIPKSRVIGETPAVRQQPTAGGKSPGRQVPPRPHRYWIGGLIVLVLAMAWSGFFTYKRYTEDVSYVIRYHAGEAPSERHCVSLLCSGESGWYWTLSAGEKTGAVLEAEDAKSSLVLSGDLQLTGSDCNEAQVAWEITTTEPAATPIAAGTLRSGSKERPLTESVPRSADRVVLKVERTDRESCDADLRWNNPGLNKSPVS
ncbi:helix-turn-helix domain-containing protein [Streptomyces sp. 7N604]|uniref:helix-turn-helix domain-containing protein n=1 Tax=Streptomyces sp. 7N604 TaxID=3457415 RepID=UPI003FD01B37